MPALPKNQNINSKHSEEMNSNHKNIQVIIAGGGPAGAATALSLNARGIKCLVIEAEMHPKFKAGETIPPNALPLFRKLGIDQLLHNEKHLISYGNRMFWGSAEYVEKTFLATHHANGWHLDRCFFEQQLKERAINEGIGWMEGTRIVDCTEANGYWTVNVKNETGSYRTLKCNILVEATGKASRIAKSMGLGRHRSDNLTGTTVCLHTNGNNCPNYTFIEACANGWWYVAPLSGNRIILTFMTDADLLDKSMLDYDYFYSEAMNTNMVKEILEGLEITGNTLPINKSASTSNLAVSYGEHWVAVGDAAISYDPLSSYGMTSALESGFYAGHAIADKLEGIEDALLAYDFLLCSAYATYKEMHAHQYQIENRWPDEIFWKRRNEQSRKQVQLHSPIAVPIFQ